VPGLGPGQPRVPEAAWNLSWTDVLFHPFVWTFGDRPYMLSNISPLFLGFLVPWLLCRDATGVRRGRAALALGMLTVATWLVVAARALHTRYLLVGLALLAIGLAPAFVAFDEALGGERRLRLAGRAALVLLLGFWLAVSGWTAGEAIRYAAGLTRREDRYRRKEGYDVAEWLNAHVAVGERVSLRDYGPYRYFLRPDILAGSESRVELEGVSEPARFRHVVGRRGAVAPQAQALPGGSRLAFTGRQYVVFTLPP
jgi:hypothetical protein